MTAEIPPKTGIAKAFRNEPFIIGIGGGTASGKTSIAREVADDVVEMDMFYEEIPPNKTFTDINFDHPRTLNWRELEHALGRLADGRSAYIPDYDFSDGTVVGHRKVLPEGIIAVPGLWALLQYEKYDPLEYYDHTVYVDLAADMRLARRVRRDVEVRDTPAEDVVESYVNYARPMHLKWVEPTRRNADTVVRGDMDLDHLVLDLLGV